MAFQPKNPAPPKDPMQLSPQEEIFVASYLTHFNASRAAREAGYGGKWTQSTAYSLMRKPSISTAIEKRIGAVLEKLNRKADEVVSQWALLAVADPNELMEARRNCCRYCYGDNGLYQRTQREMDRDLIDHERGGEMHAKLMAKDLSGEMAPWPEFNPMGGVGYNPKVTPNPECFECFGDGVLEVHVRDSRELSPAGRALFAGIKQTKDGIEVKMHSQEKAWDNLAKHLGVIKEKIEVEHTGELVEALTKARKRRAKDDGENLAG